MSSPEHVLDRGSEPGPHAEVDDEVDGGVGHFTHVGKGLGDDKCVAELAWGWRNNGNGVNIVRGEETNSSN